MKQIFELFEFIRVLLIESDTPWTAFMLLYFVELFEEFFNGEVE